MKGLEKQDQVHESYLIICPSKPQKANHFCENNFFLISFSHRRSQNTLPPRAFPNPIILNIIHFFYELKRLL